MLKKAITSTKEKNLWKVVKDIKENVKCGTENIITDFFFSSVI